MCEAAERKHVGLESSGLDVVRDVITKLADTLPLAFRRAVFDPELGDPRPNVIVLLNKKEIGVLDGLDTKVSDGDKLVLVPVSHGG